MSLALFLLGSLQITLDETVLTGFSTDKERALLIYLVLERQHSHRRESLAGLLWEELPQQLAFNNLRKTLHRLRQTLQDNQRTHPFLLVTAKEVRCNPAANIWLDVDHFGSLIRESQSHPHRRADTCHICRLDQASAAALYRGNFLEGFWLADNAAFEEWAARWRERLRSQALTLFGQLTAFSEKDGQYIEAMAYAQQLAALEPWQESAHRAIMRLLVQAGRRTAALAQYEKLQKILAEELGIEPEAESVHLYEQIRNGRYYPPPPQTPPGFLPPTMTPLIGRDQALLALQKLIHQPDNRLITIVGPGGIGKTRLALAGAANTRADFPDGVWFVDLTSLADDEEKAAADDPRFISRLVMVIATAIGLSLRGPEPPKTQLLTALKNWEGLLVLDNFETALAGATLIQEILLATTGVVILATSREPLRFQAEHIFRLNGLSSPPAETSPQDFLAYESVLLFQTVAARAGQPVTAETLFAVGEICRFLEGIPLGIELAASWTSHLTSAEILFRLQTEYGRLTASYRDVPERHHTMQAVFEGSWQMLTEQQQSALAQISVFRSGFDRKAADKIVRSSWDDIFSLVDKSLLRPEANGRYTIHELLRQFSAVKLSQQREEQADAANRHSLYYLSYLESKTAAFWQQTPQKPQTELNHDFENIHAAWQTALEGGNFDLLAQALPGLTTYYVRNGLYHEGIAVLSQTIMLTEDDPVGRDHSLHGWLQVELARLAAPVAQFELARDRAQKALSLAETSDDTALQGWGQFRLARTLWMQGHYEACQPLLEAAQKAARTVGSERLEAECWLALSALADTYGGNFALARERGEKALALFQQTGNAMGELRMLILLGNCSWGTGDYSLAQNFYEQALHLSRNINSRFDEAAALANLGTVLREQGAFDQSLSYYEPALRLFQALHDQRRGFVTLYNMSLLYYQMDQPLPALDYGQQALKTVRALDTRAGESQPLCCIGHALLSLNRNEEAAAAYHQSLQLHREAGNHHLAMDPLAGLVRVALAQKDLVQALAYTEEILAHLAQGSLNGTAEPIRIQLTAYQALTAVQDIRADGILEATYQSLITRAEKISDPARKQSFLQNIPAHVDVQTAISELASKNANTFSTTF